MIRTTKSVRRLKAAERFVTAHAFVGRHVELTQIYLGPPCVHRGTVTSVASMMSSGADVITLRSDDRRYDIAISLAQVEEIVETEVPR